MPGIPANITIAGRTPATIKGNLPPLINTLASARGGFRAGDDTGGGADPVGVVFSENFNDQTDWTSAPDEANNLPTNWYEMTQYGQRWTPSEGYPAFHENIEILASNASKARGGTGKSMVNWRDGFLDSAGDAQWGSDSVLWYRLPGDGLSEVYCEYYITFSAEMIEAFYADQMGMSKIFRVMAHDDPDNREWRHFDKFTDEYNKPIYIWSIDGGTLYGVRNKTSIYRWAPNSDPDLNDAMNDGPWGFMRGDWSGGYWPEAVAGQGVNGTDPGLTDYKNGGTIDAGGVTIDQVFGPEGTYVKMGHYLKMNSAPGVPDGELHQFIDDKRISKMTGINWVVSDSPMKKWRVVTLGGNDLFSRFPTQTPHEDWYSIDDFKVFDSLPANLTEA
jgi:hypothetical protein